MGEEIAALDSIYDIGGDKLGSTHFLVEGNLPIKKNIFLYSFVANKLIYVHNAVSGYNETKFRFALEAALMFKDESINGE